MRYPTTEMHTNPPGDRLDVPPSVLTSVGQSGPVPKEVVLLRLSDPYESTCFQRFFHNRNISVLVSESDEGLPDFIEDYAVTLIVTDDLSALDEVRFNFPDGPPAVVAVLDDSPEAVREAYDLGADWHVPRPLDPDRPMGHFREP